MIQTIEAVFDGTNLQPSVPLNLAVGKRVKIMNGLPSALAIESKQPRSFGLCAGELTVPTDFDKPLPAEILNAFDRLSTI